MSGVNSVPILEIRRRLARYRITQDALAAETGIHPSALSRILRGLRRPPKDFERRVNAALDRLEAAEAAADRARAEVLAQGRAA